jgi:hypothetical protein
MNIKQVPIELLWPIRRLSREEDAFLRRWMYDEAHYRDGPGLAKALQLRHRVPPADLAAVIAAAIPDPADQEAAGHGPPPAGSPVWPWAGDAFNDRLAEARAVRAARQMVTR